MSRRLATCLALILVLGATVALALPGTAAANGCPLRLSQGTTGTATDPIRIDTVADLTVLANNASCYRSSYVFQQRADLALTGVWTPIGPVGAGFNGVYDGGGYTITGLLVDQTAVATYKGLFGVLDGGTVRNLTISHGVIIGISSYYGVLAGNAVAHSLIENVTVADSSVSSLGTGSEYMGIVVGGLYDSTVRNATVTGGSVAIAVTNDNVGGIVGQMYGSSALIERSSADVSISGAGSYVGGLVGIIYSSGAITDSYARGTVQGAYAVGGLVGAIYSGGGPITRSYATTHVVSTNEIGGLVGWVTAAPAADAVASFWDTQTSGIATSSNGAVGKTTSELTATSTFADAGWSIAAGFDATKTWAMCAAVNGGYPFLTAAHATAPAACIPAAAAATAASTPATIRVRNARLVGNTIRTQITVSGPGTVVQTGGVQAAPAGVPDSGHEPRMLNVPRSTRATLLVSCSTRRTTKAATTISLTCALNARTLRLAQRRALVILVRTTFRPAAGAAATASTAVALPKRAARPGETTAPAVTG